MRGSLLLVGKDKLYIERFIAYLMRSINSSFDITCIDSLEAFYEYDEINEWDVLLIEKAIFDMLGYATNEASNQSIVVFEESVTDKIYDTDSIVSIHKYQSAGALERLIVKAYMQNTDNETLQYTNKEAIVIGCFSPTGGSGTSTLAKIVAEVKSIRGKKVLYVPLDCYSDQDAFFQSNQTYNLSDYSTYIMTKDNWSAGLEFMVSKDVHTEIQYLKDPIHIQDMVDFKEELLEKWLTHVKRYNDFDYIVLDSSSDLTSFLQGVNNLCDQRIYINRTDVIASKKWRCFCESVKISFGESFFDGSIKVSNNLLGEQPRGNEHSDCMIGYDQHLIKYDNDRLQLNHGSPVFKKIEDLVDGF